MKRMYSAAGIAAIASFAIAGSALAFGPGQGMDHRQGDRPSFQELDADGDGEVTRAEIDAHRAARFAAADANGDGKLSLDEMQAEARKKSDARAAAMLKWLDADGDGALSAEEMPQRGPKPEMLMRIDTDMSGGISEEEFAAAREKMGEHRKMRHHRGGQMGQHGGGQMGGQKMGGQKMGGQMHGQMHRNMPCDKPDQN